MLDRVLLAPEFSNGTLWKAAGYRATRDVVLMPAYKVHLPHFERQEAANIEGCANKLSGCYICLIAKQ